MDLVIERESKSRYLNLYFIKRTIIKIIKLEINIHFSIILLVYKKKLNIIEFKKSS